MDNVKTAVAFTSEVPVIDANTLDSAQKATDLITEFHRSDHSDDIGKLYDAWPDYDTNVKGIHYRCPVVTADVISGYIPTDMRSKTAVMDIACGTGLLGEELRERGFAIVDGLDPSGISVDLARKKNVYRRLICGYVTEKKLDIDDGTYDLVAACGALAPGHLPAVSIHEFMRIAKPGAPIILTGRRSHWEETPEYRDVMKPLLYKLQDEGRLKIIAMETMTNYYYVTEWHDGVVIALRKV